jgi:hypothetical protein
VLFNKRLVCKEASTFRPTEHDLKVIERYNRLDHAFYRCVRTEFDRKVTEIWRKETEQLYGKYLKALELYRRTSQSDP